MTKKHKQQILTNMPKHIIENCLFYKNKDGRGGVAIDSNTHKTFTIDDYGENFALDKDIVNVSIQSDKLGNRQAAVQQIVKHNTTNLVGSIQKHKSKYILRVTNPKFGDYLVIVNTEALNFERDELFNSVISNYPSESKPYFEVTLINSIGKIGDDQAFLNQTIIEAGLPVEFSHAASKQAKEIPDIISLKELSKRTDLRNLAFVTIDGEDAKDFDDAVYCEFKDHVYHLYVAIADVSHYVTPNSPLDHDAYLRGNSVYFPTQVIPMLPEHLSNGLCSLNPQVDRLVMCCQMQVTLNGEISGYEVYNGVINSKARLTYNKVEEWIKDQTLVPEKLQPNISNLYAVYQALIQSRIKRGAIDFESTEPLFIFDAGGLITNIVPRIRLEAHRLIEECMLAANVSVADFLISHNHPGLFRIHEKPSEEKFKALKDFLNSLAIKFDVSYSELKPKHYQNLLTLVHNHPQFLAIQQTVLRSMQLAIYSPDNVGHFGLSYDKYLHFTSPIRRYPDLLVHRVAKKIIEHNSYNYSYTLQTLGEHTSFTERRSEELERKADTFYKCQYARSHIGSEFTGLITSVVNFGVFVFIPDLLLDGLLHVTELNHDYYIFDEKRQILTGRRTGTTFHNGQELKIEIAGVDMSKLFIDLKLADEK